LGDKANVLAQGVEGGVAQVGGSAVFTQTDLPILCFIQAEEKTSDGGFAAARAT
jgi:hypothetical protein